jgi:para-nitrobenzyl esterase
MLSKRTLLTLVVILIPVLTGSQCVFIATSGDTSSCKPTLDKPCNSQPPVVVVAADNGQFIDAPVQGLRYESGHLSGITGDHGEFQYEAGHPIRFFIGDIALGEATTGKAVITPLDLVLNGTIDTPAVINIARFLQSLDSIPDDNLITLPAVLHTEAARSNAEVSTSILYLDFSDDTTFVNTATQLISTFTASYPFTAALVDRQSAREHLVRNLAEAGISPGH